ncbi:vitamin B12 import system permease protein BtuC, partial [Vibrio parahaemolyticus V-223/04]
GALVARVGISTR